MSYNSDDTICAISSASGGAARGIIRLTGPQAVSIAEHVFSDGEGLRLADLAAASTMSGSLHVGKDIRLSVPCEICVWPTARSYTREPVVELHTVGSPAVLQVAIQSLCSCGARLAEPGEFTLRAFLAGRLDLTQAEAVLGVIDAGTNDELHSALSQLAGGLAQPLKQVGDQLVQLLAELEAGLDFVDEDIRFISHAEILDAIESMQVKLSDMQQQIDSRRTARELVRVVLVGPPNAGKSSLFNALVDRFGERSEIATPAIVSSQAGTTRDYLTAIVSFKGAVCELVDMAGIDLSEANSERTISAAAQLRSKEQLRRAELPVYCVEACDNNKTTLQSIFDLNATDRDIFVVTKSDVMPKNWFLDSSAFQIAGSSRAVVATSTITEQGLDELGSLIRQRLAGETMLGRGSVITATAERCRESVGLASSSLDQAAVAAARHEGEELVAADLRVALAELGKVIGAVYTDDLLDRIFKTFCIGK